MPARLYTLECERLLRVSSGKYSLNVPVGYFRPEAACETAMIEHKMLELPLVLFARVKSLHSLLGRDAARAIIKLTIFEFHWKK